MREFRCNKTTSDDHQVFGQLGDAHNGVAGVVVDARRQDGWWNHRSRTRRDHHLIGDEFLAPVGP